MTRGRARLAYQDIRSFNVRYPSLLLLSYIEYYSSLIPNIWSYVIKPVRNKKKSRTTVDGRVMKKEILKDKTTMSYYGRYAASATQKEMMICMNLSAMRNFYIGDGDSIDA